MQGTDPARLWAGTLRRVMTSRHTFMHMTDSRIYAT
jgi:hypothetical protein